ncbi:MAG: tRNA lysidine(34) synthetase TilS [Flavobacteriaceae bacterium]|nr:tRNA lysidine(34) synthetase TilS [Flavobacteriaceae bacterium]
MEHKIEKFFNKRVKAFKQCNFLIGVSGGVDSMVTANLFLKYNLNFSIAHCNFKLRSLESDMDCDFVKKWSLKNKIHCYIKKFNTLEYCKKNKIGVQEGARKLRYAWFDDLLNNFNFDYLVTAHHLDDQIETYLINSTRGSGINGLLGITSSPKKIFRPLLDILKIDILDFAYQNSIEYREDSSNNSDYYQRNMIRNSILPKLKEFDDNVMLKFKTTIRNLQSTKIFVDEIMENTKNDLFQYHADSINVNIEKLENKKPLEFYVHNLFYEFGFNYKEVIKIFKSDSGKLISSSSHIMTKVKGDLIIKKND